jgi:hypothetical protein
MDDQVFMWQEEEGEVQKSGPNGARRRLKSDRLDVDTDIIVDDVTARATLTLTVV